MKILKWLLVVVLVLVLVLLVGGLMLPRSFTVERSVVVSAPVADVYAQVAAPRAWKAWSVWNRRDPAMQITYSGPAEGTGATWAWKSASEGDGRMTMTAAQPPNRVGYALYFPDFDSTSTGSFTFTPEDGATRVVWQMQGDMGANPLYHWMPLLMRGTMERDFDAGLANLKALVEQQ